MNRNVYMEEECGVFSTLDWRNSRDGSEWVLNALRRRLGILQNDDDDYDYDGDNEDNDKGIDTETRDNDCKISSSNVMKKQPSLLQQHTHKHRTNLRKQRVQATRHD